MNLPVSTFSQTTEYTMKAVSFEKFAFFTEWPAISRVSDTSLPFIVTVLGDNSFDRILDQIYKEKKIKNKKVQINYISSINEIGDCHLLFISGSEEKFLARILEYTESKPILTIGDTKGYAKKRVIVNLFLSGDNIRFEINETALHRSGLYMSSHLLNFAKIINPAGG